jgi:putative serine protease PepD
MTETPHGSRDAVQTDSSPSPQVERPPHAGSEWRRPDAPSTPPHAGAAPETGPGHAVAPEFDSTGNGAANPENAGSYSNGFGSPANGATGNGVGSPWAVQRGAAPVGQFGAVPAAGPQGAGPQGAGPQGAGPQAAGPQGAGPQAAGPQGAGPQAAGPQAPRYGSTAYPGYGYGMPPTGGTTPPTGGGTWPYGAPEPKKPRPGSRLVAVGALTAVLGGLAGGGLVAALDRNDQTAAGGITVQGSSAPAAANQSGTAEAAAATAMKSVVTLSVRGQQEGGTGSGVVIRSDGYILTNEHVIAVADGGGSITVAFSDGRTAPAKLVGADKATDLAVVKVNLTGLTAATFADSDTIKVGQTVVAVGSPLGLNGTVTEGIVSALHRPTSGASDNSAVIDAIQTDAAINPGNSGGALVDLAGRVVGINQSIATAGSNSGPFGQQGEPGNIGIGFAIPSDTAVRISQELISTGKATHAQLGVETQTATSDDQQTAIGATIASVTPGSAAADAGIKAGDVVTKVDDRVIGQSEDLAATVRSYAPGTKVTLTIKRGNDTRTVAVTLGSDAGH